MAANLVETRVDLMAVMTAEQKVDLKAEMKAD